MVSGNGLKEFEKGTLMMCVAYLTLHNPGGSSVVVELHESGIIPTPPYKIVVGSATYVMSHPAPDSPDGEAHVEAHYNLDWTKQ